MTNLSAFKPAGAHIVYQTIEGEVILINLRDGFYFSVTNAGTSMWELLAAGFSASEVIDTITTHYDIDRATVESDFLSFVDTLQAEGLLVPTEPYATTEPQPAETPLPKYTSPSLEKFSDMEDILTLDPIHDVSESGWPNT